MPRITESAIESLAIKRLQEEGYEYNYGPDIAFDGTSPERESYSQVLLLNRLRDAVSSINPHISTDVQEEAIKELLRINSTDLLTNNETFHRYLTEGIPVSIKVNGSERGNRIFLVDFENPLNNDFLVVNQFTVQENNNNKRPDLIIFVNGIPLVVFELKNANAQNASAISAFNQLETYKHTIPSLFTYNAFSVISNGLDAKAGTISSLYSRFMAWKSYDGKMEASGTQGQIEVLIKGMLKKETLLDIIRHFIVFEKESKNDENNITSVVSIKKIASYHQYYAVNKAVASTLRASGYKKKNDKVSESPESYGLESVNSQEERDRKAGVVWHTQGSGKSLSMVFYAGKIILEMDNPTLLIITDRNDLDDQLFDTFASSRQLLRQDPKQAESSKNLKELLNVEAGGVVFSTIQKFQPENGNIYEELSRRENIVVIADEAHRTQYGFKAKIIDDKNAEGNIIGKKIVYGFAKYMRDALPNATYLGFTGTPIEKSDINTPAIFGNYVDIYDITQAVADGATVPIYYESRLAKVNLSEEGKALIEELELELQENDVSEIQKTKSKFTQLEALIGSKNRIKNIASDIVTHFENRQEVFEGKSMIVCMSRRIAADLYEAIIEIRPDWHDQDLSKGKIKVVMTSASSDGPKLAQHNTTKQQRRELSDRMKNPNNDLKIVIVCDMWLTGFDVPCLHSLYIDKPMKGHNLMQAIARVNRVFRDKPGGLVIDYLGIASDLKHALSFYSDAGGKGAPTLEIKKAVDILLEQMDVISQMYYGFPYQDYFQANTSEKLSIILGAENHILGLEDGKKRYIDQVNKLSKAYAIAVSDEQAVAIRDEVAFFQTVKARLVKFLSGNGGRANQEIETSIRQVIDKALVSEKIINIYDAAGIKKPEISILSEEFLIELKGLKHKNIALEVLKKVLGGEIRSVAKTNIINSRSFKEMLDDSIRKYHNKIITAAEVIEELIELSKHMTSSNDEAKDMGLSDFEYGFYTAVADNDSARELMQKDRLRELAVELTRTIQNNASIDWTIKDSVRAKLRVAVRRLLRKYGYPPDMQLLATETVLKQAEMIANELAEE